MSYSGFLLGYVQLNLLYLLAAKVKFIPKVAKSYFAVSSGDFKTGSFGVMASDQEQLPRARAVQVRSF